MPAYTTESSETGGRRQKVAVVVFIVLAVVANYLPGEAQQEVASALRATVLRPFVVTQEGIAEARVRATESGELRARLDSLVAETTTRSTLEEENLRLRGLLSLSRRLGPDYRAAAVIRPGTAGSESMFLVDVGAADSVLAWAPVITRHGLLGVLRDVQERTSLGMDWTHPDFRASAITLDGSTSGMVESHRGDFREEDRLVFNGTPFHTTLEEGTVVVTSGLGGVYPRGIPIGRVRGLSEADAGWRKSYWLEPFVDPGRVTHVLVASGRTGDDAPPADVGSAWPEDSIVTAEALVRTERTRQEALAAMGDSLEMLRAILGAHRTQDSLRQVVLGDSFPPFERPAAPTASALEEAGVAPGRSAAESGRTGAAEGRERRPPPTEPERAGPPLDTVRIFTPDSLSPISRPPVRPDTARPDTTRPDTTRRVRPDTTGVVAPDVDRLRSPRASPREGGE